MEQLNIMDKLKDIKFCKKCNMALMNGETEENCSSCREISEKNKKLELEKKNNDIERLGGLRCYKEYTIERFDNKDILEEAKEYPNCNLYIYGNTGVGKTHLATALLRRTEKGKAMSSSDIFRSLKMCEKNEEIRKINELSRIPMLIDDLGTEKQTEFTYSIIYDIINNRYKNYANGLIITSNLSMSELATKMGDDRIVSRLFQMCKVINLKGKDRRTL